MKKIAITTRLVIEDNHGEVRDTLDVRWIQLLSHIGFNPIVIPTGIEYSKYIKSLNIDGIVFSGGNDLFSISKNELSELNDMKDKRILDFAINESIPVYGVCRGMQFIAEYLGSTLNKISNHVAVSHKIKPAHSFWGSEYLNESKMVNSYHNYTVNSLPKYFNLIVRCSDNSIEIAKSDKYKILNFMFHPERSNISQEKINKIVFSHFKI